MQEFDLHAIWADTKADAEEYYQRQREQLLTQARRRSESVLQKLQRQFMRETALSLILGVLLLVWFFTPGSWIFWGFLCFWLASLILVGRIYYQFHGEIASLPLLNVKASTENFLRILREHGQRLVRLYWLLGPLGLIFGYFAGFLRGASGNYAAFQTLRFWAISIPLLVLTGWLGTYYARWRYQRAIGQREGELEEILRRLEEVE